MSLDIKEWRLKEPKKLAELLREYFPRLYNNGVLPEADVIFVKEMAKKGRPLTDSFLEKLTMKGRLAAAALWNDNLGG